MPMRRIRREVYESLNQRPMTQVEPEFDVAPGFVLPDRATTGQLQNKKLLSAFGMLTVLGR